MTEVIISYNGKLNSELTEEERKQKISDLCRQSLEIKWKIDSNDFINNPCPFCDDSNKQQIENECCDCICPKEICENHVRKGIINELIGYTKINRIPMDMHKK